jgi:hypothetical protein
MLVKKNNKGKNTNKKNFILSFFKGGENNVIGGNAIENSLINQSQAFIAIIIIGYFGIKIVYGLFFGFYPKKYYYRDIEINTNDIEEESTGKITKNVVLNAYVPGLWNNEMTDFITVLVMAFIIFVMTNSSSKSYISKEGTIHPAFIIGYIIGLGYPVFIQNFGDYFGRAFQSSCIIQYMYLAVLIAIIFMIVLINYYSNNGTTVASKINYIVYIVVLALLIFGLIFSKKNKESYNSVTYSNTNGSICTSKQNGVIQSSAEIVNITAPFVSFIILLLFSYEPSEISMKYLYIFMYAVLLGIFVSSISYYGMEFLLVKEPQKECNSIAECSLKKMPTPVDPTLKNSDKNAVSDNSKDSYRKNNSIVDVDFSNFNYIVIIKFTMLALIMIGVLYLIFFYYIKARSS